MLTVHVDLMSGEITVDLPGGEPSIDGREVNPPSMQTDSWFLDESNPPDWLVPVGDGTFELAEPWEPPASLGTPEAAALLESFLASPSVPELRKVLTELGKVLPELAKVPQLLKMLWWLATLRQYEPLDPRATAVLEASGFKRVGDWKRRSKTHVACPAVIIKARWPV